MHVTQYWTAMIHYCRFCSTRHVATELTRPKSGGLCHLVRDSAPCVWDQSSWHRWAATASAVCVVQLGAVADWPMPNTLACLYSWQRLTFRTYFVAIISFSLYLMNFILRSMLDAAGDVLGVHYKSTKCGVSVSFSQHNVFRWGGHFSYMFLKFRLA